MCQLQWWWNTNWTTRLVWPCPADGRNPFYCHNSGHNSLGPTGPQYLTHQFQGSRRPRSKYVQRTSWIRRRSEYGSNICHVAPPTYVYRPLWIWYPGRLPIPFSKWKRKWRVERHHPNVSNHAAPGQLLAGTFVLIRRQHVVSQQQLDKRRY